MDTVAKKLSRIMTAQEEKAKKKKQKQNASNTGAMAGNRRWGDDSSTDDDDKNNKKGRIGKRMWWKKKIKTKTFSITRYDCVSFIFITDYYHIFHSRRLDGSVHRVSYVCSTKLFFSILEYIGYVF